MRAGSESLVHPIAGPAFFRAFELDSLHFKLRADQIIQIYLARDDVAARCGYGNVAQTQGVAKFLENFGGKEGDLSFVLVL